ncbi:MAG: hypothetical protein JOZ76_21415 [Bradyrhizobium sp.]|nr:hypothetical protein [Bradyrhizobium sp.]MBV8920603.1 hypothetical protein [Bradyrhizobium sp.]
MKRSEISWRFVPGQVQKEEAQGGGTMNKLRLKMAPMARLLLAAGAGAGIVALSTASASAAIACRYDACWHVHEHYAFAPPPAIVIHRDYWRPPTARIIIHEESWRPPIETVVVPDYYGYGYPDW